MSFSSIINNLARIYNKFVMSTIAIILLILLLSLGFDTDGFSFTDFRGLTIISLWVFFTLASFIFTLNGFLINLGFAKEVRKFEEMGKPVKGVRGFSELVEGLKSARTLSGLITIAATLSLVLFLVTPILSNEGFDGTTLTSFSMTMAFLAVAVVFIVNFPEDTALDPGGLTGFYEPDSFPIPLDNVLSDVVLSYLDPVTFMKIDEYLNILSEMLEPDFEDDEDEVTRLERAFEKILLIAYLSNSIPSVVTKGVVKSEIKELIGSDDFESFYKGDTTGLSWEELTRILVKVEAQAPEIFRLVDRLLINLNDNYKQFTAKEMFFTVSAETNQGSIRESSGMIVFFLNNTPNENRIMKVIFDSDIHSVHPSHQEIKLGLDPQTDPYPNEQPPFIAEGKDILTILATILQVGDAIYFRFKPSGFGYKVIKVHAEESETGRLFGTSLEMKFTKSISWYIKTYAPKLSALGGIVLPLVQGLIFAS